MQTVAVPKSPQESSHATGWRRRLCLMRFERASRSDDLTQGKCKNLSTSPRVQTVSAGGLPVAISRLEKLRNHGIGQESHPNKFRCSILAKRVFCNINDDSSSTFFRPLQISSLMKRLSPCFVVFGGLVLTRPHLSPTALMRNPPSLSASPRQEVALENISFRQTTVF